MSKIVKLALIGVVVLGFAIACGAVVSGTDSGSAPPSTSKKTLKSPSERQYFGDGIWEVGVEIEPGTYKTVGSDSGVGCYWERDRDSEGTLDSIIANDYQDGPGRITVKRTDEAVKFTGGCDWVKVEK